MPYRMERKVYDELEIHAMLPIIATELQMRRVS